MLFHWRREPFTKFLDKFAFERFPCIMMFLHLQSHYFKLWQIIFEMTCHKQSSLYQAGVAVGALRYEFIERKKIIELNK